MANKAKCADCSLQIKRLSSKPFYETRGREGLIELSNTIHKYGHEHAEAIIDEALIRRWGDNGNDSVPSPSDIWQLCRMDVRDFETSRQHGEVNPRAADPNCPNCQGSGWQEEERTITSGVFAGETRSGMRRCRAGCVPPEFDPLKAPEAPKGHRTGRMTKAIA